MQLLFSSLELFQRKNQSEHLACQSNAPFCASANFLRFFAARPLKAPQPAQGTGLAALQ
jgi:hypothetical protein